MPIENLKDIIKAARVVASWDDETKQQIMELADELKAQASTAPPAKKRGPKPGAKRKVKAAPTGEKKGGWPKGKKRGPKAAQPVNGAEVPAEAEAEEEQPTELEQVQ